MGKKENQRRKWIAIAIALITAIIAFSFAVSKYVLKKNDDKFVKFNEYMIRVDEIQLNPENKYTSEGINVKIEIDEENHFTKEQLEKAGITSKLSIQYKVRK